jgi:hypothetical protein
MVGHARSIRAVHGVVVVAPRWEKQLGQRLARGHPQRVRVL